MRRRLVNVISYRRLALKRGNRLVLAVIALAATTMTAHSQPANAASGTCGTVGNYFDGVDNYGNTPNYSVNGIKSDIVVESGAYCAGGSNPGSFSSAWTMVTANEPPNTKVGYAQAGIDQEANCGPRPFAQSVADGQGDYFGGVFGTCGSYAVGSKHNLETYFRSDNGYFSMYRDGVQFSTSNFRPNQYWNPPYGYQINGETGFQADDMDGTPAAHTLLENIYWQNTNGEAFSSNYPGNTSTGIDSNRWGLDNLHVTSCCGKLVGIWTQTP